MARGRGGDKKEREKRWERVTDEEGRQRAEKTRRMGERHVGREGVGGTERERDRVGCAASTRSAQFTNRYSPLFVFTAAGRESTRPLPPSPVICLGQIQSQPRGGFELTINFKRVRRPFHRRRPTAGGKEEEGRGRGRGDRQATVFSRVSDRRSAKGINLS